MDNKFLDKSAYIRIPASEVKVGMFVAELDRPWLGTPFLTQGFSVSTPSEIKKLRELCSFVYVEKAGRLWSGKRDPFAKTNLHTNAFASGKPQTGIFSQAQERKPTLVATVNERSVHVLSSTFFEEFPQALRVYKAARNSMAQLLTQARSENKIDMSQARKMVSALVHSVLRHPDPLMWLTHSKDKDAYLLEHCLHVCILAVNFGRVLRLEAKDMLKLGLHGLLADLGMIRLPLELLRKVEKLTPEEVELVDSHPLLGRNLLMNSEDGARFASDAVINHHERLDQKGYPRGLNAKTLPQFSRMISIIDAYDAMTSPRVYAEEKSPLQALQQIYGNRGKQFDEEFALEFIHSIGPYPPGTLVELKNGSVAVVLTSDPKKRQLPMVAVLLSSDKKPQQPAVIDLRKLDQTNDSQDFMIQRVLRNGDYGVSLMGLRVETMLTADPITEAQTSPE
ncbi:HD-GYP domain-containing protein [Porticoccus sp.]